MDNNIQEKLNEDSQNILDMGRGCEFCGCSGESKANACEGCFKLHTTDWLAEYPNNLPEDILEVRFKNTRRSYYKNVNNLPLAVGDIVAVEASPGHDIGIVSLTGDMVARQMRRVGFNPHNGEYKSIYRKAKPHDIEKWQEAIALEHKTMIRARQIAAELNLNMKIGDVEYQGDKIKAIFYYIADDRVDFRELIKVFAEQFRIRVEMKQIGARQEAGRIGGLGSCGRELCCSSWISSFSSVTTNAARTQDISLNPQKLAGQCSKLKCCLMYEYDDYMDALKEFPRVNEPLRALDGDYFFVKNDILARTMSFSTAPNSMDGLVWLPIDRVKEIIKLNRKGVKPDYIEEKGDEDTKPKQKEDFTDLLGEDSITRFDETSKRKRDGRKSKNGNGRNDGQKNGAVAKNGKNRGANDSEGNSAPQPKSPKNGNRDNDGRDNGNGRNKPRNGAAEQNSNDTAKQNRPAAQSGEEVVRNNRRQNRRRPGNQQSANGNAQESANSERNVSQGNNKKEGDMPAQGNNAEQKSNRNRNNRGTDTDAKPNVNSEAKRDNRNASAKGSNGESSQNRRNRNRNRNRGSERNKPGNGE